MTNKIELDYKQSLLDLKEINDDLFYDDLKEKMNEHLELLQHGAKKVDSSIADIQQLMNNIIFKFQDQIRESTLAMSMVATNVDETIATSIQLETNQMMTLLNDVFQAFQSINVEQKEYFESTFVPYAEENLTQHKTIACDLQQKFSTLLRDQKDFLEKWEAEWKKVNVSIDENHTLHLQKFEQLYNKKMQTVQDTVQQVEKKVTNFLNEQHETSTSVQRQFETRLEEIQSTVLSSKKTYELQLTKQHEVQAEQFNQLVSLINTQANRSNVVKKWFIALSVSQLATIGTVIGLYFFR